MESPANQRIKPSSRFVKIKTVENNKSAAKPESSTNDFKINKLYAMLMGVKTKAVWKQAEQCKG